MSDIAAPTINPNVVMTELDDATGVLLSLDTKSYYTLNATGIFVWKALADGRGKTLASLAADVARNFEVDAVQAEADVTAMLDDLAVEGLVKAART